MADAAKVIDWNGTDVPAGVGELLAGLPPGRYRIAAVPDEEAFELTPEQEAGIEAARQSAREGRVVAWDSVNAELKGMIAAARGR